MAHSLNYAQKYTGKILEIVNQGALTSPFITSNVEWTGAKTFHFTQQAVSGYKNHSRNGGWNKGTITETDKSYTVAHDRDISFLVDKADVDETARTAAVENVTNTFVQTQQIPELDCYAFSKIAQEAVAAQNGLVTGSALTDYTAANVYSKLVEQMSKAKLKLYRQKGSLVGYVRSEIMDVLALSSEATANITVDTLVEGERALETRVARINGVPLFEVIDTDRFYDLFDFTEGAVADSDAHAINVLFASVETVHTVPKISSIYYFSAGSHTEGDGDLYQNRSLLDTFVFPNGLNGKIDSIFVDMQIAAFDATATYAKGDLVVQTGKVYQAKAAIATAGAFDVDDWDLI